MADLLAENACPRCGAAIALVMEGSVCSRCFFTVVPCDAPGCFRAAVELRTRPGTLGPRVLARCQEHAGSSGDLLRSAHSGGAYTAHA